MWDIEYYIRETQTWHLWAINFGSRREALRSVQRYRSDGRWPRVRFRAVRSAHPPIV